LEHSPGNVAGLDIDVYVCAGDIEGPGDQDGDQQPFGKRRHGMIFDQNSAVIPEERSQKPFKNNQNAITQP
jgi:hypothetical protein